LPATSRPSAKVSVEPEALKSTSSRIRRSATMLKSLLGISMPTALLPGIGASMRSERRGQRHRQVVREGLDPADLDVRRRLDLVLGDDRAGIAATTARRSRTRQLLDDDLLVAGVDRVVASRVDRYRDIFEELERWQDVLDPVLRQR
jgi:hypothetical protein